MASTLPIMSEPRFDPPLGLRSMPDGFDIGTDGD